MVAALLAGPALGAVQRPLIVTSQDHSLVAIDDCEHFHTRTTTSLPEQAQGEEQHVVPLDGIETLKVRASEEGGVSVKGWDRPIARLTVCKYAAALTQADAQKTLRDVTVRFHDGEVAASGPEAGTSRVWWVHMILRVPKSAALDVVSTNGGIAIRNMSGRVVARAPNGGISVASCNGESRVSTENGGISLDRMSGRVDAVTQHGPIALKVHDDNTSVIEAHTDELGEIRCRAKICFNAKPGDGGGGRTLRIGGPSAPTIHLTTSAAPIVIEQVR
jgi:hypothetical protein